MIPQKKAHAQNLVFCMVPIQRKGEISNRLQTRDPPMNHLKQHKFKKAWETIEKAKEGGHEQN